MRSLDPYVNRASRLSSSWRSRISEALDTDIQQWFHDSPLAGKPERAAIIDDRMGRLFDEMVSHLGFDTENFKRQPAT